MAFTLIAMGAALAVAVEMIEAVAIVLAVGATRSWPDAFAGAAGGVVACAAIAAALGPALAAIGIDTLRLVIGVLLLAFGLEWLRKGTLRLGHHRARSSSVAEYEETVAAVAGTTDWTARAVAFKGVLLEGVEIVLIVTVLAERPGGATPAVLGAIVAALVVLTGAVALRAPLARIPETELKWGVGVMLTALGTFFAGEGMSVHWYGGDAALVYVVLALGAVSWATIRHLARTAT